MVLKNKPVAKRQTMPVEYKDKVFDRPEFLSSLVRGAKALEFVKLAIAIKSLGATETLVFDTNDFLEKWGKAKGCIPYMRAVLKKHGITQPAIPVDATKVYVWDRRG